MDNNSSFIDILFNSDINSLDRASSFIMLILFNAPGNYDEISYESPDVTRYVYDNYDIVNKNDNWINNIENTKEYIKNDFDEISSFYKNNMNKDISISSHSLIKFFNKVTRNVYLALVQYETFFQKTDELNKKSKDMLKVAENVNDLSKEISIANKQLQSDNENLSTDIKKLDDDKNKIYTDFIAVLGVFTSITFAIFGGLNLISNLFKNVNLSSDREVGSSIILASVFLLCMYITIVALFVGISKIIDSKNKYVMDPLVSTIIVLAISIIFVVGILVKYGKFDFSNVIGYPILTGFITLVILVIVIYSVLKLKSEVSKK